MGKEISFSEFLKEGALQEQVVEQTLQMQETDKPLRIEPDAPATDKDLKTFWKTLRHFFRTGERPPGVNGILVPALLAPYLRAGNYTNDYPVFIDGDGQYCMSFEKLIQEKFDTTFDKGEAKILKANLPRILKTARRTVDESGHFVLLSKLWGAVEADLHKVDVHGDKEATFTKHIEQLREVLPNKGKVVRFSDEAPFVMLQTQLEVSTQKRQRLLKTVTRQIAAIREMIDVEATRKSENHKPAKDQGLQFASEMIAFDKMDQILPNEGTEGLGEVRVKRLQQILKQLEEGKRAWEKQTAFVNITESLFDQFAWSEILEGAEVNRSKVTEGYKMTEEKFDQKIELFARFIAAHRMADLELLDKYKEDIHDDFYEHFTWHRLTDDELDYFPPVIFIGETAGFLKNNLSKFSALLAANKPIRLIAIDKRLVNEPDPDIDWEDASHAYRQELAALAFAHRSTQTFQCAINQPEDVFKGMKYCMDAPAPAIMHFLIPDTDEIKLSEILKLSAAVEGRFFPFVHYDLHMGNTWESRFQIHANPQPEKDWPEYEFNFMDQAGSEQKQMLPFTYADYKAVTQEKVEELFIIPEAYQSDDLIHIADYLKMPMDQLTGKVPFIWLVDSDNKLKKAAMPYMWVVSCQERLDYWNYIQELGGVNSFHVNKALNKARETWEVDKEAEITKLKEEFEAELDAVRQNASGEAMERLTNILLNLDDMPAAMPKTKPASNPKKDSEEKPAEAEEEQAGETEESEELELSSEPWIETFKCTSCNECTDKYPTAFKYNEDKQAELTDPSSITFAELVMAAEECPANCIHPGAPTNPNEPNLDEWVEKAAKYN